jgi:hypothetical protein
MDWLKFKLKFDLRPYFFYFSLLLFKTLTSDSLFLTLFHLNIHSLFIFLLFPLKFIFFHNFQNTLFSHFPPPSPSVSVIYPLPLFFFFSFFFPFFTTIHVPLLFSFFFLSFFSPPPTYPLPFFLLLPHSNFNNFINRNPKTSAKKKSANLQTFTAILQKLIVNL